MLWNVIFHAIFMKYFYISQPWLHCMPFILKFFHCAILSVLCSFVTLNNPWPESSKLSFYSPWATTDRFTISFAFQLCCLLRPLTIFTRGSFDDIFIQQKFKTMFLSYNKVFLQHYCQWAQQWDCLYYRHDPKYLSRLDLHLIMSGSSHFWDYLTVYVKC